MRANHDCRRHGLLLQVPGQKFFGHPVNRFSFVGWAQPTLLILRSNDKYRVGFAHPTKFCP